MIKKSYNRNNYGIAIVENINDIMEFIKDTIIESEDENKNFQNQSDNCMTIFYSKLKINENYHYNVRIMSGNHYPSNDV